MVQKPKHVQKGETQQEKTKMLITTPGMLWATRGSDGIDLNKQQYKDTFVMLCVKDSLQQVC